MTLILFTISLLILVGIIISALTTSNTLYLPEDWPNHKIDIYTIQYLHCSGERRVICCWGKKEYNNTVKKLGKVFCVLTCSLPYKDIVHTRNEVFSRHGKGWIVELDTIMI